MTAFVINDRVKQTTTTTGTGTIDLTGTETGFETFVAGIGDGVQTYYAIVHDGTADFEVGTWNCNGCREQIRFQDSQSFHLLILMR